MLLVVPRLEPLLLLLLVVVNLIVASLAGGVAGAEAVVGVARLELSRHALVASSGLRRIHAGLNRQSYTSGQHCVCAESHLVEVPRLLSWLLHEASRLSWLASHSLVVQRLPLISLQVAEAPVPRELSSHSKVPVQRSDGVRHPPALGVLHLGAHFGHGGVPPVHEAAAHKISSNGH